MVDIDPSGFTIGRGRDNDLVLEAQGISRHHCRIYRRDKIWMLEDLGSVNGVRLNGSRIEGSQELQPGDRIGVGTDPLLFSDAGETPLPAAGLPEEKEPPETPVPPAAAAPPKIPGPSKTSAPPAGKGTETGSDESVPAKIPWLKIAILAAILLLTVIISVKTFGPDTGEADAGQEETVSAVQEAGVPEAEEAEPVELSDSELAELIAEEEAQESAEPEEATGTAEQSVDVEEGVSEPPVPDDKEAVAEKPPHEQEAVISPAAEEEQAPGEPVAGSEQPAPPAPEPEITEVPAEPTGPAVAGALVESTPVGATVLLDGAESGITPVFLRDLEEGRHMIQLRKEGFEQFKRQIHVPDVLPRRPYELRQKPGTLRITSELPGVTVWHGTQLLGRTPLVTEKLPDGNCEIKLTAAGCEPQVRSVSVSELTGEKLHVKMVSVMGRVEFVTSVPDCAISIDGTPKGITERTDDGKGLLIVEGLPEGEYLFRLTHPHGAVKHGRLKIHRGKTVRAALKVWAVDTRIVLTDRSVRCGMLVEKSPKGDVVLGLSPNPKHCMRIPASRVDRIEKLDPEEAMKAAELLKKKGGETAPLVAPRLPEEPEETPAAAPPAMPASIPTGSRETFNTTVEQIERSMHRASATDIHMRYRDRDMILRGVPVTSGRDGLGAYVLFGSRIRCFFDPEYFAEIKAGINAAEEAEASIMVRGTAIGLQGDSLVLRECRLITE